MADLTYNDVKTYVADTLAAFGYGQRTIPHFSPGPVNDDTLAESPDAIVYLMLGSGPGLSFEATFDSTLLTARSVGPQNDFDGGRKLALDLDHALLLFCESGVFGNVYSLGITRAGGPPDLVQQDKAKRYHHSCSYVVTAESGL